MADIFVSYASTDREQVRPVVSALTQQGWSVWWDRDIAPGAEFEQTIDHEISLARCVLVVWSEAAVNSRWVRNEALEGLERDILLPVRLDQTRIPVAFRQTQAVDLSGDVRSRTSAMTTLIEAITAQLVPGSEFAATHVNVAEVDRPTLAVMPFSCPSQEPEDRFLVQSLVMELTARLAGIPGFFVISSGTTLGYTGETFDPAAIGRALGVRYVIEGSLQTGPTRTRIHAGLTDTHQSTQLWSQRLEFQGDDRTEVEDDIVHQLVSRIEPALARSELTRMSRYQPSDLDAWSLCRQAISQIQVKGWHEDVVMDSIRLCEQASDLDPQFALAFAGKSVYLGVGQRLAFWLEDTEACRTDALRAAHAAIEVADGDSQVLGYAGCALADCGETEAAFPILDLAIDRDPSNAQAYMARSIAWRDQRDVSRAIEDGEMALRLSPRDTSQATWLMGQAANLLYAGRVVEAKAHLEASIQRDPRYFGSRVVLCVAHMLSDELVDAAKDIREAQRLRPNLIHEHVRRLVGTPTYDSLEQAGLLESLP